MNEAPVQQYRVGGAAVAVAFWLAILALPAGATDAACSKDVIEQSVCIYQAILADIRKNYRLRGGGGISSITQNSTTSFTAGLAQEGRVDLLHYEIKLDASGRVSIAGRSQGTRSY
jgi:hypothetical protein